MPLRELLRDAASRFRQAGDAKSLIIIGSNSFTSTGTFVGAQLVAYRKPPSGSTCPISTTIKITTKTDLRAGDGFRVFAPVPANQIDDQQKGIVIARDNLFASGQIWLFDVSVNPTTGFPAFGPARRVNAPPYSVPPDAPQPSSTLKLDTLDARFTQAVLAFDPFQQGIALWTQHTIANVGATRSRVRFYEIDPRPIPTNPPTSSLIRFGDIDNADTANFFFNAAISPDRRVRKGQAPQFGNSFVIQYNVSSTFDKPGILVSSGVDDLPLRLLLVKSGVGPYRDNSCVPLGSACFWGTSSAANPDPLPNPNFPTRGVVWGTNQFSGVLNPLPVSGNARTQVFAVKP